MNAYATPLYLGALAKTFGVVAVHFHVVGEERGEFIVLTRRLTEWDQADRIAHDYISDPDCRFDRVHVKKCEGQWCGA